MLEKAGRSGEPFAAFSQVCELLVSNPLECAITPLERQEFVVPQCGETLPRLI